MSPYASRYQQAKSVIAAVHARLPEDATLEQRKSALYEAYPFGDRAYWPYKMWCKAQREYLARYIRPEDAEAKRANWRDELRGQGYMFAGDGG